ncbi:MAG TPA: sugar transporter, partial [Paenirhodobacter sp.]
YHSRSAFSVRSENYSGALTTLAAFTQIGQTSAPESAILYDYIRSQQLMEQVDATLGLRKIFNLDPGDFVFSLRDDATTEDMLDYWQRMVGVSLDSSTNILTLEVHAFRPEDAVAIAQAVIGDSSDLVNHLSAISRDDTLRAASEDLSAAQERMRDLSSKIRVFREENSIIDPSQDVLGQMGVLGALQSQLASALIEKETILPQTPGTNDPRLTVVDRKIEAIRNQIAEERARVREPEGDNQALSTVIGQYEGLLVDLEFARTAYTAAMAALEQARAEARRQSRYVAVHIDPTLAQDSLYPRRGMLSGLIFLGLFAAWAVMALIYYNIRDRG